MPAEYERKAWGNLYRNHADDVRAGAASVLDCRAEQEGVVHEVFLRALEAGEPPEKPSANAYFYQAGRNTALNRVRGHERQVGDPESAMAVRPTPDSQKPDTLLLKKCRREAVRKAIAELPRRRREVAELSWIEERTRAEIAQALGISVGRVDQHRARAREDIRRHLMGGVYDPDGSGGV